MTGRDGLRMNQMICGEVVTRVSRGVKAGEDDILGSITNGQDVVEKLVSW